MCIARKTLSGPRASGSEYLREGDYAVTKTQYSGRIIGKFTEIRRVIQQHYGLTVVEQRLLGGEVDQNVWVRTDVGLEYLFKVSTGQLDEALIWQQTVLDHLELDAPHIPVPRLVPSTEGLSMLPLDLADGACVVRLLTWLPGKMFAELGELPASLLTELGEVAGHLTESLARLPVESAVHSHHWDIRRSRDAVTESLPFVESERDRRDVSYLMAGFDGALDRLNSFPTGVVHQDLNDFNVLALPDASGHLVISGVLDVNDALLTARVAEVAIAAAYAMLRQDDPLSAAASVVAGFDSVAPLSSDEISVLFPLAIARLCVNATTWTRRTAEANHPYGEQRMEHTWPTLRKLAQLSPALAEKRLRAVCADRTKTSKGRE